jgi:hypothetical protein
MRAVRDQYLGVFDLEQIVGSAVQQAMARLEGLQTGGDSFCYWMLYHFDLERSVSQQFVLMRMGDYPLYDDRLRVTDINGRRDIFRKVWGEISAQAEFEYRDWTLAETAYYRVFFSARNGMWHQDLQLAALTVPTAGSLPRE